MPSSTETSSSSGRSSSSKNSPWHKLDSGALLWKEADARTQNEIARHYAPKIKIIALRMKSKLPQNVELSELISAGSLGLMEAFAKFDPKLGIKFETYAENRIKGAMLDELRRLDWFSRGLRQKVRTLENATRKIEAHTGETATAEQLAEESGMDLDEVESTMELLNTQVCLSFEAMSENLASFKQSDDDGPFQQAVFNDLVEKAVTLIEQLTPREKLVLSLYYAEELNMRETAEVMEITEGRVSQLHSQALAKLRTMFHNQFATDEL